jgi:sigma-B regulation protein RsbU (phosphoserine phosphatase)
MAVTAMCLRALAREPGSLDGLIARVNDLLCQRNDTQQFVTLCAGILDTVDGELIWVNCGHPGPLLVGPGAPVRALDEGRGPPLGVFEGLRPECQRLRLRADEVLLIYTDGVTEAIDLHGALYGEERLVGLLGELATGPAGGAGTALEAVLRDVEGFSLGAPPADDLTLLALRLAPR